MEISVWSDATKLVDEFKQPATALVKAVDVMQDTSKPAAERLEAAEKVMISLPKAKTFKAPAKPAAPKTPATKEPKMTQQEGMAKLVEIYNRNPDKQNAKEIVAFKQKAKKGWDFLGVTDAKFIKKITERAKL